MVFSSLIFLCVFLPVVFLVNLALPGIRLKNAFLALASLVFYAYGEPVYVVLMLVSVLVNWAVALGVERLEGRGRQALCSFAVTVNLLFLAVFKYADMLIETAASLLGLVGVLPAGVMLPEPNLALPIGISFYTFQALSYVIDVYRGDVPAQRNFGRVLLFISFFPQLIAGPIIKYHDVEQQIACRKVTAVGCARGLRRFSVGLGKKVVFANSFGVVADALFSAPGSDINIVGAWVAALAYLMQIYFDFSGYSDMAIGLAQMFGFEFKENFKHPYVSTTIKEFWRRWHISLSTWFKLYLYIPLGGNRKGRPRTVLNKLLVFFCCGLWHGAAWTFVVWGLMHGMVLLLEEYVPMHKLPRPLGWLYTMLVVTVAFVLFRADTFGQGALIISQMFTGLHFEAACMSAALVNVTPFMVATFIGALFAMGPWGARLYARAEKAAPRTAEYISYIAAATLLVLCFLMLSSGSYNPFIYFRF